MNDIYADNKKFDLGVFTEIPILSSGTYDVGVEYTPENAYNIEKVFNLFNYWQRCPFYKLQWYSANEWGFVGTTSHMYQGGESRIWMTEVIFRTDVQSVKINKSWSYVFGENTVNKEIHKNIEGFSLYMIGGN